MVARFLGDHAVPRSGGSGPTSLADLLVDLACKRILRHVLVRAFAADHRGDEAALPAQRLPIEQPVRHAGQAEHRGGKLDASFELKIDGVDRLVSKALDAARRLRQAAEATTRAA